jgi:hypothetical protein
MSLPNFSTAHDPAADPFTIAPDDPTTTDPAAICGMPDRPLSFPLLAGSLSLWERAGVRSRAGR